MDSAQEIKTRLDVVDIVSEYIPLKPAGTGAFKAPCPFHQERTPSFYVNRQRQSWHCFGCDQGGDLISFVMRMEGMEFIEAIELLAQKAGIVLPKYDGEKASQRKRLHEVNDLAVKFFRASLQNLPEAEIARAYLAKRGLDDLTTDLFQIGYSPDSWTALSEALAKKGVTETELLSAGLSAKRDNGSGVYDRFRGRVMFPIADVHGNIVGFTARILKDDKEQAKYVNTPETSAYKKSAVLYGLDKAKGEIRRLDLAVIVEGNMDVVGSHQFGVTNVVASSGTALTAEQLMLIKRFSTTLAIAFDQDAAGNAATLRGLDLARQQDFSIKIITLPPEAGKDPDDAVRKNPELWKQAIKDALGIMEWIYQQAFRKTQNVKSAEGKKQIAQDVLPEISRIVDAVEKDHWLKRLAKDLDVSEEALKEALKKNKQIAPIKLQTAKQQAPVNKEQDTLQERVFAYIISRQDLFKEAVQNVVPEDFSDAGLSSLYNRLKLGYAQGEINLNDPVNSGQTIRPPATLSPDEAKIFDALAFMAERETQGQPLDELKRELNTAVEQLRVQRRKHGRLQLEQEMREAERLGDQARILELLKRFQALN